MKHWWQGLTARERKLLSIGGAVIILLSLYYLIWAPLNTHVNNLKAEVVSQQDLLAWMQRSTLIIRHLSQGNSNTQQVTQQDLLPTVDESLKKSAIADDVTRLSQMGQDKVQVNFNNVAFDPFIRWLTGLLRRDHLAINAINITPKTTGQVAISMTLKRS